MTYILTIISIPLLAQLAVLQAPEAKKVGAKPNIIFVFADDMGWGDLHCYGHPYAQTPNLDRLAAEGTRFTQCYATGVTCCPSRTGLMTSWLPARYPVYPANGGFADRVAVTELLRKAGYATGHFGKWHIGPEAKAGTYGIDVIASDDEVGGKRRPRTTARARDAHLFDSAAAFIVKHKDAPFYVNIWCHIPHYPINPSSELLEAFGSLQVDESQFPPMMREKFAMCKKRGGDVSKHMRAYLAELKALDAEVGRLLAQLDAQGLRDNTIVVFSSDQGPAGIAEFADSLSERKRKRLERKVKTPVEGNDGNAVRLNAMGYAGPFRGGKHGQYEGGVRVPFILRWPGNTPADRVDDESVISLGDWLPTLCTITGVKIDAADFDGEDVSASWLGRVPHVRAKPLLWKTNAPQSPGAIRDGQWKLHYPNSRRGELELYDITADPGESRNLAAQHPDIVRQLTAKLQAWQATLPKQYEKADDGTE